MDLNIYSVDRNLSRHFINFILVTQSSQVSLQYQRSIASFEDSRSIRFLLARAKHGRGEARLFDNKILTVFGPIHNLFEF